MRFFYVEIVGRVLHLSPQTLQVTRIAAECCNFVSEVEIRLFYVLLDQSAVVFRLLFYNFCHNQGAFETYAIPVDSFVLSFMS